MKRIGVKRGRIQEYPIHFSLKSPSLIHEIGFIQRKYPIIFEDQE
jgi:hypothetical protein